MCDCHSYNADIGNVPEVILDPNEYFNWDSQARTVCVDACIADQIKALWEIGIWTVGCCCGHNGLFSDRPNVILDTEVNHERAITLLNEIDPEREWDVLQWQLTKCN